jgi:hypothetical protein
LFGLIKLILKEKDMRGEKMQAWYEKMQDVPNELRSYFSLLDNFLPDSYFPPNQPPHPVLAPRGYCRPFSPQELQTHKENFIKQQKISFLQKVLQEFVPSLPADYAPPTKVERPALSNAAVIFLLDDNITDEDIAFDKETKYFKPQRIAYIQAKVKEHNEQIECFIEYLALDCLTNINFVPNRENKKCFEAQKSDFLREVLKDFNPDLSQFRIPRNAGPSQVNAALENYIEKEKRDYIKSRVITNNDIMAAKLVGVSGARMGI